jgi:hypothetical protein
MSNFKFSKSHNPELDAARIQHDSLPKTEYGKGKRSWSKIKRKVMRKVTDWDSFYIPLYRNITLT